MSFDLPFVLPDGWEIKTVEQLIKDKIIEKPLDGNHGGIHPKSSDYVSKGIPFVMASDLHAGRVDLSGCKFIKEKQANALRKGFAKAGDVLISHKATIGRTAIVQQNDYPYIMLTPQVTYYRIIDDEKLFNVYLKAYFDSPFFQSLLALWAGSGSTRAYLGITGQLKLPVIIPPIDSQKFIANHVFTFNEKIELNTQINQTLEQMAQAIFKSWFVDFDPVKAKIEILAADGNADDAELAAMSVISAKTLDELNSLKASNPETFNKLAQTAALLPAAMQDSELGEIPEGWENHHTQDLFEIKDGTHDSPKKAEEGHYLVTSKHITKGKVDTSSAYLISDADFDKVNQRSKVDTFDILLTMIGTVGEVVVVYDNPVEFAIKNVGLFKTSQRPELVWLFYWHLQSFKMKHYLEVRMAGTTQQYLTLKTLRTIPVILPSNELLIKFNEVVSPLMSRISDNYKQSQTLSNLRDTLLPKLLSGEVDLSSEVVA